MASEFIIKELNTLGGAMPKEGFQEFRWTAKARSIPVQPWSFGVRQRTIRTDYPGVDDPTEQILGPNYTEFTLNGRWDDRYNSFAVSREIRESASEAELRDLSGGFAVAEWRRFEAMVRRGNPVRITFEDVTVQGVITSAEFDYKYKSNIGYSFTVSPHHRSPGGFFAMNKSPRSVLNSNQLLSEVTNEVTPALELHDIAPQEFLVDDIYDDATSYLNEWTTSLTAIEDAIQQRQLTPELEPNASLLRLAALFYSMGTTATSLRTLLRGEDSSEALAYEDAMTITAYDAWARGIMYYARRVIVASRRAAAEIRQRAEPNAIGLYTPQVGEHLYAISNRFYRTPHNWRVIAERNRLSAFTLEGTELLIIPEITSR